MVDIDDIDIINQFDFSKIPTSVYIIINTHGEIQTMGKENPNPEIVNIPKNMKIFNIMAAPPGEENLTCYNDTSKFISPITQYFQDTDTPSKNLNILLNKLRNIDKPLYETNMKGVSSKPINQTQRFLNRPLFNKLLSGDPDNIFLNTITIVDSKSEDNSAIIQPSSISMDTLIKKLNGAEEVFIFDFSCSTYDFPMPHARKSYARKSVSKSYHPYARPISKKGGNKPQIKRRTINRKRRTINRKRRTINRKRRTINRKRRTIK